MENKKKPRGLRNNNPLNIRAAKNDWQGQCGKDDAGFCVFESLEWGYRAAFRTIDTYRRKYNINKLKDIISRWAPPEENDTKHYVQCVSDLLCVTSDCIFSMGSWEPEEMERNCQLVCAMAIMENGWHLELLNMDIIKKAYKLAFPVEPWP